MVGAWNVAEEHVVRGQAIAESLATSSYMAMASLSRSVDAGPLRARSEASLRDARGSFAISRQVPAFAIYGRLSIALSVSPRQ